MCPVKTLQVVDDKPEWLTNELLTQMRQRDKAFRKARRTGKQEDWNRARLLRNRLGMDIKSAKANTISLDVSTLEWFNSYLAGRSQCVKLNNLISDTLPIMYGVPQGVFWGQLCLAFI